MALSRHFYAHHSRVPPKLWPWRNFSPEEMACRHCGALLFVPEFMAALQDLREQISFLLPVTSGYRCEVHNAAVGGAPDSAHLWGLAVDIRVNGVEARDLLRQAIAADWQGIGIKQHGPHDKRFIHLDLCEDAPGRPRPWIWSYP